MPASGRRRAFGQHFLKDSSLSERIVSRAVEEARRLGCVAFLEIGPGRGALTLPLLDWLGDFPRTPSLLLCEKDRRLAESWRARAAQGGNPGLTVEAADFLDLEECRWLGRSPLAVISNLPYSSGTAILDRLARHPDRIPVMVLMFQAEVAQRLRAEPGTRSWGSLSLWIQNQWDVSAFLSVPPRAFSPPPDVHSEVVVLLRRDRPRIPVTPTLMPQWESLLKSCFAHRRKMLRSGLAAGSPARIALEAAALDGTKRAEALSWEEWDRFYRSLIQTAK